MQSTITNWWGGRGGGAMWPGYGFLAFMFEKSYEFKVGSNFLYVWEWLVRPHSKIKKIIFKSNMYSMKSMTKQQFEIHLPYPWRVSLPIGDENVFQPPHVMSIGNIIKSILITMMKILTMLEPTPLNIAQQIHMKLWDHHLNNASMSILWVMHKSNFEPL